MDGKHLFLTPGTVLWGRTKTVAFSRKTTYIASGLFHGKKGVTFLAEVGAEQACSELFSLRSTQE